MFLDRISVKNALFGLVGFEQTSDPEYDTIAASLLESRSGRFVNRVHPLLTIENIDQSIKNFSRYSYTAFAVLTEYSLGEKVSESEINYEYINANPSTGNTPPNATFWKVIDELSDFLIKSVYQGIDEAIDAVLDEKKIRKRIKSIYENVLLFDSVANYTTLEVNNDKFVGLRLRLKKDRSLITLLNKIGTHFTTIAGGDLTMRLYHSSQQAAIATYTITPGSTNSSKWTVVAPDKGLIRYLSDDYAAGGDFYLGYKQSDLAGLGTQAINVDVKGILSCGCSRATASYFQNYSEYVDIIGFTVDESEMPADVLFDPNKLSLSYGKSYGLNLNMTNKCDIGPFILDNEQEWAQVIDYSVGIIILRELAFNTRGSNATANQVQQANRELYVNREISGTTADKFNKAVKATSFDFSGLNDDCLPTEDLAMSIGGDEVTLY